ncbi:unnamed protein product [Cercospora beticola]|nr:unnamed protein product [Cercospora beticola]
MFKLPPEILHLVCQHCDTRDVRTLRQVSSEIKVIADEYMLKSLRLSFDRQEFSELAVFISNNPNAAKQISKIHFQADRLPIVSCQEEWERCRLKTICDEAILRGELQSAEHSSHDEPDSDMERTHRGFQVFEIMQRETSKYNQEEVNQAWTYFQDVMQDQQSMDRESEVYHCMADLFKNCRRLDTITLTLKDRTQSEPFRWRRQESYARGMVRPWGDDGSWSPNTRVLDQILLAAYTTGTKLRELNVMPISYQFFGQKGALIEKLCEPIKDLRKIQIQINDNFGIDREVELEDGMLRSAEARCHPFAHPRHFGSTLRPFQLPVTAAMEATRVIDALNDGRVYEFLGRAQGLEELVFHGPDTGIGFAKMDLKAIVGECPWKELSRALSTITTPKVLLTGATGYLGGTLLAHLVASEHPALKDITYTCIIRGEARIPKLKAAYGDRVKIEVVDSLDDIGRTADIASQHHIVINAAISFHVESALALIRGLSRRQEQEDNKKVLMLHTSGTSNLADRPITNPSSSPPREFDDTQDDIYTFLQKEESGIPYPQRTTELAVLDAAANHPKMVALSIMPPTIFGTGTGIFNTRSVQVPAYVNGALKHGKVVMVGTGDAQLDHVHVEDLAELYALVLVEFIENGGEKLPRGREAIIFAENGRHSWGEAAQGIADTGFEMGVLGSREVESVTLAEGAKLFAGGLIPEGNEELI